MEFLKYTFNLYFFLKRCSTFLMLFKSLFIFSLKYLLMFFAIFFVMLLINFSLIFSSSLHISEIIHCFVYNMSWKYFAQVICFLTLLMIFFCYIEVVV